MIDMKGTEVQIRVARYPNKGWRLWLNAGGLCALLAYGVPELYLDGLRL